DRVSYEPVESDRLARRVDYPDDQVAAEAGRLGNVRSSRQVDARGVRETCRSLGAEVHGPVDRSFEREVTLPAEVWLCRRTELIVLARADPVSLQPHPWKLWQSRAVHPFGAHGTDLELALRENPLLGSRHRSRFELREDQDAPGLL